MWKSVCKNCTCKAYSLGYDQKPPCKFENTEFMTMFSIVKHRRGIY